MALTLPTGFLTELTAETKKPVTVYEIGPFPYNGTEVLTDGGLETWASATDLTNWVETNDGTDTTNRDGADQRSGTFCARIDRGTGGATATGIHQVKTTYVVGKWYHLTFWVKSSTARTLGCGWRFRNDTVSPSEFWDHANSTWTTSNTVNPVATMTSYTRVSAWIQISTSHATGDQIRPILVTNSDLQSGDSLFIDDVSVVGPFDQPARYYSSQALTWLGNTYTALAVRSSPATEVWSTRIPGLSVTFSNINNTLRSLMTPDDLLTGNWLTARLLLRDSSDALLDGSLVTHKGIIDGIPETNEKTVTLRSVGPLHNFDNELPIIRTGEFCQWKFADGINCNYTSTTTTTNSGSASTGPINVADASLLVEGKTIKVGDSAEVTISDITGSALTVDTAITWASSATVAYTQCNRLDEDCTSRARRHEYGGFRGADAILGQLALLEDIAQQPGSPLGQFIIPNNIFAGLRSLGIPATAPRLASLDTVVPVVLGRRLVSGVIVERHVVEWTGAEEVKVQFVIVSSGEINAFNDFYIDKQREDTQLVNATSGRLWFGIYWRPGTIGLDDDETLAEYDASPQGQQRPQNRDLLSLVTGNTYSRYAYVTTIQGEDAFDSEDLVDWSFDIDGIKFQKYNADGTEDGSPVFTRNPVWQLVGIMLSTEFGFGRFLSAADLDFTSIHAAATTCDTVIDYTGTTFTGDAVSTTTYAVVNSVDFYRGVSVTGVAVAVFGTGTLDDMTSGGIYTDANGDGDATFTVEIEVGGGDPTSPNTFRWRKDAGAWDTGNACSTTAQELQEGVTVVFGAVTGHADGDDWTIAVIADTVVDTPSVTTVTLGTSRTTANGDTLQARGAQYTCDLVIDSPTPGPEIVARILATCHGYVTQDADGKLQIKIEGSGAAVATFKDVSPAAGYGIKRGSFRWVEDQNKNINRVRVDYIDHNNVRLPAVESNWGEILGDTPGTGKKLTEASIDGSGILTFEHAYRVAKFQLDKNTQENFEARITVGPAGLQLQPGDRINVTHTVPGWTDEEVRVKSIKRIGLGSEDEYFVELGLIDYDATVYGLVTPPDRPVRPGFTAPTITLSVEAGLYGRVHLSWTVDASGARFFRVYKAAASWAGSDPEGGNIISGRRLTRRTYTYTVPESEFGTTLYFVVGAILPLGRRLVFSNEVSIAPSAFDPVDTEDEPGAPNMVHDGSFRDSTQWLVTTPTETPVNPDTATAGVPDAFNNPGDAQDGSETTFADGDCSNVSGVLTTPTHDWEWNAATRVGRVDAVIAMSQSGGGAKNRPSIALEYSTDNGSNFTSMGSHFRSTKKTISTPSLGSVTMADLIIRATARAADAGVDNAGEGRVYRIQFQEIGAGPYGLIGGNTGVVQGDGATVYGEAWRPFPGPSPEEPADVVFASGRKVSIRIAMKRNVSGSAATDPLEVVVRDIAQDTTWTLLSIPAANIFDDWDHAHVTWLATSDVTGELTVHVRTLSTNPIQFDDLYIERGGQVHEFSTGTTEQNASDFSDEMGGAPRATGFTRGVAIGTNRYSDT